MPENMFGKDTATVTLADRLGIPRTRTIQFLDLLRIPVDLRVRLRAKADLTEAKLRAIVQMDTVAMRVVIGRILAGRGKSLVFIAAG